MWTQLIYDGDRVIEEWEGATPASATVRRRFVYGDYIDEPVMMQTLTAGPLISTDTYYYMHDRSYSVGKRCSTTPGAWLSRTSTPSSG